MITIQSKMVQNIGLLTRSRLNLNTRIIRKSFLRLNPQQDTGPPPFSVLQTEVVKRNESQILEISRRQEKYFGGQIACKTWNIVYHSEVPNNANILKGMYLLEIRNEGKDQEIWKARFVVQGHSNELKTNFSTTFQWLDNIPRKMLIRIAAIFDFRIFSTDVTKAYSQSAGN